MKTNQLIDLLRNGEKFYFHYLPMIMPMFNFSSIRPGTKDDYSHYLYLDQKTGFFCEIDKKTQKTHHRDTSYVQKIIKELELEQKNTKEFLNQTF